MAVSYKKDMKNYWNHAIDPVFMFPNERAAEIAVKTVQKFKEETNSKIKVIFNVFKDEDLEIYWRLLCTK